MNPGVIPDEPTVMLTISNQAEIWCVASYAQNLLLKEISADLDQQFQGNMEFHFSLIF